MNKLPVSLKLLFVISSFCLLNNDVMAVRYYVKPAATGTGNGSSWANASGNLNAILQASVSGDEVWVMAGTYKPAADVFGNTSPADPRDKTYYVPEGVQLYGGFAGTETLLSQRNIALNITLLDGDIGTAGSNSDNCYHLVMGVFSASGNTTITVDGFTIQNGNANGAGSITLGATSLQRRIGGGIIIAGGMATNILALANNTVKNTRCDGPGAGINILNSGISNLTGNTVQNCNSGGIPGGGGVYIKNGTCQLNSNVISNNITNIGRGGGILIENAISVTTNQNSYTGNSAAFDDGGGGICIYLSGPVTMTNDICSGNFSDAVGGGIFLFFCGTSNLSGLTVQNNSTNNLGGGIGALGTSCNFSNITVSGNSSPVAGGGLLVEIQGSLRNSNIANNNAGNFGGGLTISGAASVFVVSNNTFTGNSAQKGGAMICGASCQVDSNQFISNTATGSSAGFHFGGGAVYLEADNSLISNNTLRNNSTTGSGAPGGAIYINGNNNTVKNNSVLNNTALGYGGGMYINSGAQTISNNTIINNTGSKGGGIGIIGGNSVITNNTIINNNAGSNGGGFFIENGTASIHNNIFWVNKKAGNTTVQGADFENATTAANSITFKNNLLQLANGNYTSSGTGLYDLGTAASANLFNINPQFADINNTSGPDGIDRSIDDGLMLNCSSPAVSAGDNTLSTESFDITGSTRIQGATVDLGAYEFASRAYVNPSSSTLPSNYSIGRSWSLAYPSLSDALEAARNCNNITEVWVKTGTYKPTMAYPGNSSPIDAREKTFYIPTSVKVYGGFAGTETTLSQRNTVNNETILSGDIGTANNNTDNCYHVVAVSASNATVDGFTIRDGNANNTGTTLIGALNFPRNTGGGVFLYQGNNTLKNNIITANNANIGGGVYSNGANNTISHNFITGNTASQRGGGLCTESSNDMVVNNLFWNNSSSNGGGGIYNFGSNLNVVNNTFYSNAASNNGGAVMMVDGFSDFSNNIFWNNTKGGSATVQSADYFRNSFDPNNNKFRNNLLQLASGNYSTSGNGSFDLSNSATGNIFATDPLFKLPANAPGPDGKLRTADDGLLPDACSPVINTGNNTFIPTGITTDIINNARIQLSTTDMGAYEASGNTANQNAGIVAANLSITKTQTASTAYTNDCTTLIALVSSTGASPISGSTTARVWIESTPPNSFVKRHYEITPAANAATATGRVTLYFTQQDFTDFNTINVIKLPVDAADAANNKANLRIEKRGGTSNNGTGLPGSYTGTISVIDPADADIIWNSVKNRWEVSFDVTGFSGFFVKTTSGILPVNWISFSGNLNNNKQTVLHWKVEEQNVIRYEVEKSSDGNTFFNIETVPGQGDGNHAYNFTEATPLTDRAYYRIRQVDRDGHFSYSTVIILQASSTNTLSVYPNPFTGSIQIRSGISQTILLNDITGRPIKTLRVNSGTTSLSLDQLAKGMYIIKTMRGESIKLIKN